VDEKQRNEINQVVPAILEQLAFLFADPIDTADFATADEAFLAASLTFTGPAQGGMMVAMPLSLARELAANLLGSEPDDPKAGEHAQDSVGEFLNVAAGHILTRLHGTGKVIDLSAPRPFPLTAPQAAAISRKPGGFAYTVDGAPILFLANFCDCCTPESEEGAHV
jgi:chemotaxis protein CheY-P-specific phosphatase CheC